MFSASIGITVPDADVLFRSARSQLSSLRADIDLDEFIRLYGVRAQANGVKIPRGMDFLFVDATHDAHAKIPALISQWNTVGALESEVKLRFSAKLQSSRSGLIGKSSIVMIEATRESGDTKTTERRYYVSSLPPNAARIAQAVRAHWRIENSMHWVLDMAFGEDQCRVRVNNAAQNFAILRRICLNLLKADTTTKAGIKNRRLKAGASDGYRAAVLRL